MLLAPFVLGTLLISFWRRKNDPPQGVVPLWAQRVAPWIWAISLCVIFSVAATAWPLHLSFRGAQPELEKLVAAAHQGKKPPMPHQIGDFEILDVSLHNWGASLSLTNDDGESPTQLIKLKYVLSAQEKEEAVDKNNTIELSENWIYYEPSD